MPNSRAELVSRIKTIYRNLIATGEVTSDIDQITAVSEADGEIVANIINQYNDENGEPLLPGMPVYRAKDTGRILAGRSCYRCRGCHSYFRVDSGHEITEPIAELTLPPDPEGLDPVDSSTVLGIRLPPENGPRSGFCDECFKKEKSKRFRTALRNFFLNPFKAMVTNNQEVAVERPTSLPAPRVFHPQPERYTRPSPPRNPHSGAGHHSRNSQSSGWSTY